MMVVGALAQLRKRSSRLCMKKEVSRFAAIDGPHHWLPSWIRSNIDVSGTA